MSTSARSRQRDNVLRELVESEKAHVADLELVETNFLLPLKARVKDVALLSNVSSNLSMIRSFNLVLLDELVKTDASVGKTFCRLADFSKMLVNFSSAQPLLLVAIAEDRKSNRALDTFLEDAKKKSRGLDLGQLLLKPVQRTCKYPLLLQELVKATPEDHPDHPHLVEAIKKTSAVVSSINDHQKNLESFAKIAQLAADLKHDVPDFDLFQKGRVFLREAPFTEVTESGKRRERNMVMFSDVLIVGKYSRKKQFRYRAHYLLSLCECESLPSKFAADADKGFTLVFKGDSPLHTVWPSKDAKFLWFDEITRNIQKLASASMGVRRDSFGPMRVKAMPSHTDSAAARNSEAEAKWHERLDAKESEQAERLAKEEAVRKHYDDRQLEPTCKEHVLLEPLPSLLTPAPDKMADISPLLHLSRRFSQKKSARPEIVILGEASSGRSSLLDALLGGAHLSGGMSTPMMLHVSLQHSAKLKAPLWRVESSVPVPTVAEARDLLRIEYTKKAKAGVKVVHVIYESPACYDMLIVDTPPLGQSDEWDALIAAECLPAARTLLCVEATKAWDGISVFPFVVRKRLDPSLERSVFVYTKFHQHAQLFLHQSDMERFLQQCPCPAYASFVTLANPMTSGATVAGAEGAQRELLATFTNVPSMGRFRFGIKGVLDGLVRSAYEFYVHDVFSATLFKLDKEVSTALGDWNTKNLQIDRGSKEETRSVLSHHFQRFTVHYCALMEGSAEVGRVAAGSTLVEELTATGAPWLKRELGAEPISVKVPFADCKLAAGAKMQRLINEFREIISGIILTSYDYDLVPEDRPLPKVILERERVQKSLQNNIVPAVQIFSRRVLALVQEVCDAASGLALREAPESEMEILHQCKLAFVRNSMLGMTEHVLAAFRQACGDYLDLNIPWIAADFNAKEISQDLNRVLHSSVIEPLLDANRVLNTLHTSLDIDHVCNKWMLNAELKKRTEAARVEHELLKESLNVFSHHYNAIVK